MLATHITVTKQLFSNFVIILFYLTRSIELTVLCFWDLRFCRILCHSKRQRDSDWEQQHDECRRTRFAAQSFVDVL